tara:strand:+ start:1021 stop:2205 length:1185 start_codon:yes stop_codon:yes gene_type:complete
MNSSKIIKKPRIEVVDSLRGFAIMGIFFLHSVEHFNFYVFPSKDTQPDWLNTLDDSVWDTIFLLFGGKGYAIFALLFGFTFSLMYAKQLTKDIDFGYRFLWRLVLLACFGFINGLFFPGEVLVLYSIIGISLFLVRKLSNKVILITAIILLSQPIEIERFFYSLFNPNFTIATKESSQLWNALKEGQLGTSLWNLWISNTLYGHKAGLTWAYEVGRLIQSSGLFIFGFWLGKKKLFTYSREQLIFWKKILISSIFIFIPLYFLELKFQKISTLDIHKKTILRAIDMYGNLAFCLLMVSSFIILYQQYWFYTIARRLRFCGRMSLTAYILQSIIGSFVFYNYGLGLGPELRHTESLIVGITLFLILSIFCRFWIIQYKQGLLEKIWSKLTWINKK